MLIRENELRQALSLPDFDRWKAQREMVPGDRTNGRFPPPDDMPRVGAVLILLYLKQDKTHLLLTKRPDSLRTHSGQVSFPGGRHEPPESLAETALREAEEEVGLTPAAVSLLGRFESVYIPPSNFEVHPFVGWSACAPRFDPDPREVEQVIELPLARLHDRSLRGEEERMLNGRSLTIPYYRFAGYKVWGATAMLLAELGARLARVG